MAEIKKETLEFLKKLKKNNNKEWFDKNRKEYEAAKKNFLEFTISLIAGLQKIDPSITGIDPKKTIFRINRDIRFSADKSPYKTNMGTAISKGDKLDLTAGYYLHVEPGSTFSAAGSYGPMPPQLAAIRQEIDYNYKGFSKILNAASFKKYFSDLDVVEKLKTVPKGYSAENPAIEILKHKSFIVSKSFSDSEVTSKNFIGDVLASFKAAMPLVEFLNNAIKADSGSK